MTFNAGGTDLQRSVTNRHRKMGPGGHPARSADLARGGRPTCAWPLLGWALAGGSPSGSTSLVQVHLTLVVLDFDEIWPFVL